jgi:FkbH-like protein
MKELLAYPFDPNILLRKKKALRRVLLEQPELVGKRIAILGGSTTAEVKDMLELFLLREGIRPEFYESEYNKYYEDVMFSNPKLKEFKPEIAYLHTTSANITRFPSPWEGEEEAASLAQSEFSRFKGLWDRLAGEYGCVVIQNNFEAPHYRLLGSLDSYAVAGRTRFINRLNQMLADHARNTQGLYLHDLNYLAAWFGLSRWYDRQFWYSYKYAMNYEAIPWLAHCVASIVKAALGRGKKCLVLDLDNTLWGGVIGDDGLEGIQIGKETAEAEAYTEFQEYVKGLKERGVILAVCSKNEEKTAREGLGHPDCILKPDDFAAIKANWDPKHRNVLDIARELNIGADSLVFVDDNPVEREDVRRQAPMVAVPEMGSNVAQYINILDKTGYFEAVALSPEDLKRGALYSENARRAGEEKAFASYDDFLKSLEMTAEIQPFVPLYFDRITQLTNKSNQFNLTTRRYTEAEIEAAASDQRRIALYGRLTDRFGDNGLVSVVIGAVEGSELQVELWLMSCRVLKRGMEEAMLDALAARALSHGVKIIKGFYYQTAKNGMVSQMYGGLGFTRTELKENGDSTWRLEIGPDTRPRNRFIRVL